MEPVKSRGRDVGAEWLGNHEGRENGSVVLEDWSGRSGRGGEKNPGQPVLWPGATASQVCTKGGMNSDPSQMLTATGAAESGGHELTDARCRGRESCETRVVDSRDVVSGAVFSRMHSRREVSLGGRNN